MAEAPCITHHTPHVSFTTHRLGGMTAPVLFHLEDGGPPFAPLAVPPWENETLPLSIPGHVRGLRGVFPCLPFGVSPVPEDAPAAWHLLEADTHNPLHGPGANGLWSCSRHDASGVEITFPHADDDPSSKSSQSIAPGEGRAAVAFSFSATPRRSVRLPFGYHVMLAWQEEMVLDPGSFAFGLTYPGTLPPGRMMTKPSSEFLCLSAVPGKTGARDMARPNWPGPADDVVMLCGVTGRFTVRYPQQKRRLVITWDAAVMPACLVWFSRFGLEEEPWRNRYTAIGIEPIAAAFDFLPAVSAAPNPLTRRGIATALSLAAGVPFSTTLTLEAFCS